ncbi:hypothetical protein FIV41_20445 [Pseudomonas marginalis]|uniref:Uncharacterized protein n=1 Tax=Pseudomonas marginalis TaxID=298 RepID=A0A9X9BRU2_PSEMA|nr:hypothetical protein FIV41_20445 [Pseudomonas marginalis]
MRGFGQVSMRELAAHIGIHQGSLPSLFETHHSARPIV